MVLFDALGGGPLTSNFVAWSSSAEKTRWRWGLTATCIPRKETCYYYHQFCRNEPGQGVREPFAIHYSPLTSATAGKERPCRE